MEWKRMRKATRERLAKEAKAREQGVPVAPG